MNMPIKKQEIVKSRELLNSFIDHCLNNPQERFWQALRNWSGYMFIYGSQNLIKHNDLEDTFYKETK